MSDNIERADEEARPHPTTVALSRAPAAEVDAGTAIVLKVKVSCPHGCDLRERVIDVVAPDGAVVGSSRLAEFADNVNETTEFAFMAPEEVGEYSWTVVFPKHQTEDFVHEEGLLPITVRTLAHDTSLAVWSVPSPIVIEHPYRIQVGATCSSGATSVAKKSRSSTKQAPASRTRRSAKPRWDGTRALYWTDVDLVAPAKEGSTSRSITFAPTELRLPHGGASARFGFETVKPPRVFRRGQGRSERCRHACRGCPGSSGRLLRLLRLERHCKSSDAAGNVQPGRTQDRL